MDDHNSLDQTLDLAARYAIEQENVREHAIRGMHPETQKLVRDYDRDRDLFIERVQRMFTGDEREAIEAASWVARNATALVERHSFVTRMIKHAMEHDVGSVRLVLKPGG